MASPCIRVIELGQFSVADTNLGQANLSLQAEQAVLRLEMMGNCSLHPAYLSVMEPWSMYESCREHGPHPKIALEERFESIREWFHKQPHH